MPVPTKNLIRTVRVTDRTGLGSANEGQRKDRRRAFREVDGVWCEYSADAEQELGTTHAAFLHASDLSNRRNVARVLLLHAIERDRQLTDLAARIILTTSPRHPRSPSVA